MDVQAPPAPMNAAAARDREICSCLHVTECQLLATLATRDIRTLRDLRRAIGAGDGCTACHQELKHILDAHARATSG